MGACRATRCLARLQAGGITLVSSPRGNDFAIGRERDPGAAPAGRSRGTLNARRRPPGCPGLHRADEQARTLGSSPRPRAAAVCRGARATGSVIYLDVEDL